MLQGEPGLQILCEVSDGLAAILAAKLLKPDIILLDIGLPKLDGIAAAREIFLSAPEAKILFLTQESSSDIVRKALSIGSGFVVKADATNELLPAIRAIILGQQFLSNGCKAYSSSEPINAPISAGLRG
jgi:DNA-binding NarL/FixJ family response regulator